MISVILYGRNDAHGYNLHRRAALSLNCLAMVLTDPDDEIIFVDYNSPDELPTFIEAIADTLTDRCLDVLRVLRVPAQIHHERFASRTHLLAIEPVSRNAAVRRANPANRWLLSTNTDMVFLPLEGESLSEVFADVPDGFYGSPRFELPEWLWERLPRSDPRGALTALERLGPGLRLNEPTASHEWIRYHAPGDFQLIMRDDFVAIDGFDEEMLLGYHLDANLSRRIHLHRGSIESLADRVAAYHCNHNRVPTVYHGERGVENDLDRFFFRVDQANVSAQRTSWGLPDVALEEVAIRRRVALRVADRVASVLPDELPAPLPSDARATALELTYDSYHLLPFVADSLLVSSPHITVGYVGANPVLRSLLASLLTEFEFDNPLKVIDLDDPGTIDELDAVADIVVVDLGVDASLADASTGDQSTVEYWSTELPRGLEGVLLGLDRLIELERARIVRGAHPRRIVLVNSTTMYVDAFVLTHLDCSYTTFHSRVRRATVKRTADTELATERTSIAAQEFLRRLVPWSSRSRASDAHLHLHSGARVRIADLSDFAGFGAGWAFPDGIGIWTLGHRSEFSLRLERRKETAVLEIGVGDVCVAPDASLNVALLVDGERVAVRDFAPNERPILIPSLRRQLPDWLLRDVRAKLPLGVLNRLRPLYVRLTAHPAAPGAPRVKETIWPVELPSGALARGKVQVTLAIEEPRTPLEIGWSEDARPLGIHVRSLMLE